MYLHRISKAAMALLLSFALASCETSSGAMADGNPSTRPNGAASERLAHQTADYRRTVTDGATAGAMIGALGAAAVTALSGGDGRQVARNALIGGLVGTLIGAGVGQSVAEKKKSYVRKEDDLNQVIRQARANNAKLSGMVSTANALVARRRQQASALNRANAREKVALKAAISDDKHTISDAIGAAEKEISQLKSLNSRVSGGSALNQQINAAEHGKAQLVDSRTTLIEVEEKL